MAKLILSMDGLVLKEISLTKQRMSIGRKPNNDIQIDNLAISGEHAAVVTILNDSFLEDLNSTNGTLVNGQSVKKHFLKNGDVVELGKYKLKYVTEQSPSSDTPEYEKTMILRANSALRVPEVAPQPPAAAAQPVPAMASPAAVLASASSPPDLPAGTGAIQILNGANAGRELVLTKTLTTLGKPHVQVAVIARRPHGYFITHVEGAQYPTINGKAIDAQAHQLSDHDIIEIAGAKMEFFLKA
jgi:pSer/pThr/pTyr-binding forkhead associated (FHA) protein